jgi:hypothetical protein
VLPTRKALARARVAQFRGQVDGEQGPGPADLSESRPLALASPDRKVVGANAALVICLAELLQSAQKAAANIDQKVMMGSAMPSRTRVIAKSKEKSQS